MAVKAADFKKDDETSALLVNMSNEITALKIDPIPLQRITFRLYFCL